MYSQVIKTVRSCMIFFFIKQKTAYEKRISDRSSDVCSSDLDQHRAFRHDALVALLPCAQERGLHARHLVAELLLHRRRALVFEQRDVAVGVDQEAARIEQRALVVGLRREQPRIAHPAARAADVAGLELDGGLEVGGHRSEEHTSELQ